MGISRKTLASALENVTLIPRVIELDRSQPEVKLTLEEYIARVVTPARISKGRQRLKQHYSLFHEAETSYGVPTSILVALWGIESDYGDLPGTFPVISSVATLAFEGRRAQYFRKELLLALKIVDEGHITPTRMVGSWAGAMGHFQFMPSTFVEYALDADGDGRKDIWDNLPDAVASAAHYLSAMGWKKGLPWGLEVKLPEDLDRSLIGPQGKRSLVSWKALGVRRVDLGELAVDSDHEAWLIAPRWPHGRAFLVNRNYMALYRWNPSSSFAIAVGLLSDEISSNTRPE